MFGDRLRELRTGHGYTMDYLAELYNKKYNGKLNKSTISRYENGLQEPMLFVVNNLAELFSVSVDYLTGKEGPTPVSESGPFSPARQALLDAVKDIDDDTAKAVLEVVKSVKKLRGE